LIGSLGVVVMVGESSLSPVVNGGTSSSWSSASSASMSLDRIDWDQSSGSISSTFTNEKGDPSGDPDGGGLSGVWLAIFAVRLAATESAAAAAAWV
jgi:hypothetical protein